MIYKCKCGETPTVEHTIECSFSRWYVKCECGEQTETFKDVDSAVMAWNKKPFPTCETCAFKDKEEDYCYYSQTTTKNTWTCPDFLLYGTKIPKDDKTPLETHLEASDEPLGQYDIDEMLNKVDWQKEFIKSASDYYELSDELKQTKEDLNDYIQNSEYWYKEWKKAAEENEKLNMIIERIKEELK